MIEILETKGGEFYTLSGEEYSGKYYINNKTNIAYTFSEASKINKVLVPKSINTTERVREVSQIKGGSKYPNSYIPTVNSDHIRLGFINRYFIQKRNNPLYTIKEISEEDYFKITPSFSKGRISSSLYNFVEIRWQIGKKCDAIKDINKRRISEIEINFPGISIYLKNLLQFSY